MFVCLQKGANTIAVKIMLSHDFRSRDVEALKLMKHFEEFLRGETALSPVFNEK
jgi:hypothetical protein